MTRGSLPEIRNPQSELRDRAAPHAALVAVQVIFGTWPVAGKIALRALPSAGLVAVRITLAAVAFLLLLRLRERVRLPRGADLARFALYSLLGVVVNQFLFVKGLELSTAVNAALISTAIPVTTLLVGALLGFQKFSLRAAAGTALAAAGVVYLVDPLRADFSGSNTLGNFMIVGSTACYGAYIAVSQDAFRRYGALAAMTWVFAIGAAVAAPVGAIQFAAAPVAPPDWTTCAAVAYIVLVPTVGAYYLNAWALERVSPSTVAVYIYLQPLFAFAVAPLVLGSAERAGLRHLIAAALIFGGVAVVTWRSRGRAARAVAERPDALGP